MLSQLAKKSSRFLSARAQRNSVMKNYGRRREPVGRFSTHGILKFAILFRILNFLCAVRCLIKTNFSPRNFSVLIKPQNCWIEFYQAVFVLS